eukprot:g2720.t1
MSGKVKKKNNGNRKRVPRSGKQRKQQQHLALSKQNPCSLLTLSGDVWRIVRDLIGWTELLPLVHVCKRLTGLLQDPAVWKNLVQLDLQAFKRGGPLRGLSQIWRENKLTFPRVLLADTTTDEVLSLLRELGVRDLTVRSPCVTDAGLAHLATLPLQQLHLGVSSLTCAVRCPFISDDGLAHLSALPLTHLNLDGCEQITNAGLAHLSALPLQHLSLQDCVQITDAGLAHLSGLPLQHLDLERCTQITDAGLEYLTALPLQQLSFDKSREITDDGLARLAILPLQYLRVYRCHGITEEGLSHFMRSTRKTLQRLDSP